MSLRAYRVPEAEVEGAIRFIEGLNIRAIAERVMGELFRTCLLYTSLTGEVLHLRKPFF